MSEDSEHGTGGAPHPAIDAPWRSVDTPTAGPVGLYSDISGNGRPLLLVHSLNAAPSAHEMKPLFEHYRGERPVHALDLPGFGSSARGDRDYTPRMLAKAIDEVAAAALEAPADVIALSLGAEITARAILETPERWSSLGLISPTGFARREPPGERVSQRIEAVLGARLLAEPLFRALTSPTSIRFFLDRNFEGPVDTELVEKAIETARQPGARFGPFRFLSGRLFTRGAFESLYEPLSLPVLVLYDRDPNVRFDRLIEWQRDRPDRIVRRVAPTRGLPHWEQLDRCVTELDTFWRSVEVGSHRDHDGRSD